MDRKEFYEEAIKLGYSKADITEIISSVEDLEKDGIHAGYEMMLVDKPTSTPVSDATAEKLNI